MCGVAYVIFQSDDDIVMLFCVSFFVINKHIHENCQTTNMGESKKKQANKKATSVFFFALHSPEVYELVRKKSG